VNLIRIFVLMLNVAIMLFWCHMTENFNGLSFLSGCSLGLSFSVLSDLLISHLEKKG
jgi:multisubunit Na+/H+ antiporter MnhE subunit